AALAGLRDEALRADESVQALRREVSEATSQAAAVEARLDGLAQRLSESRARRDRLVTERESLSEELADLEVRRQALERSVAELAEGKRLTASEREELEREMEALRGRQLDSERAVDSAKNELGLKRNRPRALEDLHRRPEGVGAGARALLSRGHGSVPGPVADRVEALAG